MDKDEIKVPEEFINALRAVYSDSAAHYCDTDKHAKMLYEIALKCAKEEINYPFHLDNTDINKEFEDYRNWVHKNNLSPTLSMTAHHFANWQKKQDEKELETAEEHGILSGMNMEHEKMMENAKDATIRMGRAAKFLEKSYELDDYLQTFHSGQKVKVLILKDDGFNK